MIKSSYYKGKNYFFNFLSVWDDKYNFTVVIMAYVCQIIMLCILNNAICELYLNKTGRKRRYRAKGKKKNPKPITFFIYKMKASLCHLFNWWDPVKVLPTGKWHFTIEILTWKQHLQERKYMFFINKLPFSWCVFLQCFLKSVC